MPRAPRDLILLVGHEPSMRWRTFTQGDRRARRGARHAARRDARRAARRRPAHAPGVGHRARLRPRADRAARAEPLLVRGSDRDRRRAARRLPAGRAAVGEPVGGGPPLRRRDARTRRRRWRWSASSRAWSASPSTRPSSRPAAADYERQVNARGPERPRRPGVRRAPRAGRQHRGAATTRGRCPPGETIARDLQRFLRQRGEEPTSSPLQRLGRSARPSGRHGSRRARAGRCPRRSASALGGQVIGSAASAPRRRAGASVSPV